MEAYLTGSSEGRLRLGLILFIAAVGLVLYQGAQLAPYWISAYELEAFMAEKARTGDLSSEESIHQAILARAEMMGIPLRGRDVRVHKSPSDIFIMSRWTIQHNFFDLYVHTFEFSPKVTVNYR